MHRGHVAPISTLALAATLTLGAMLVAPDARAEPVHESGHRSYTFAVIGDVPYGDPAQAHFPAFVAGINADPDVQMVTHLGDIKSGSTTCDDQRFATVRKDFDGLEDRGGLSFATLHVVGSNDDLAPWTGIGATTATGEQVEEERHRMVADILNVRAAFRQARTHRLHTAWC
jgi:hypothetical protein